MHTRSRHTGRGRSRPPSAAIQSRMGTWRAGPPTSRRHGSKKWPSGEVCIQYSSTLAHKRAYACRDALSLTERLSAAEHARGKRNRRPPALAIIPISSVGVAGRLRLWPGVASVASSRWRVRTWHSREGMCTCFHRLFLPPPRPGLLLPLSPILSARECGGVILLIMYMYLN